MDNVDNFVYNFIFKAFRRHAIVDNSCIHICTIRHLSTMFVHIAKNEISYDKVTLNMFRLLPADDNYSQKSLFL